MREATAANPLMPLRMFRSRNVSGANAIQALAIAGMFGVFFMGSLYMERVLGYYALEIGLAFLPTTMLMGIMSVRFSEPLITRFGARTTLLPGLALIAIGLAWFTQAPVDGSYVVNVLPVMVLMGIGCGVAFPALMTLSMSGATPEDAGLASGLVNTTAQVGAALGLAVLATLSSSRTEDLSAAGESAASALTGGYQLAFIVGAALVGAALVVAATVLVPEKKAQAKAGAAEAGVRSVVASSRMPELPEAERARRQLELVVGREIVAVDDRDTYVCRPHAPGEMAAALVGHRLVETHRRGKFLWAETDGGPQLGLHLGMAGSLTVDEAPAPRNWDRFTLEFVDGGRLALRDKRRLGRAILEPDFSHVGPDAAEVGRDEFRKRVGRGSAPLKARLLDQGVISGVGNLLADEILWRARMSPRQPANELTTERARPPAAIASAPPCATRSATAAPTPATSRRTASAAAAARAAAPSSSGRRSAAGRRSGAPSASYDGPSPTCPGSAASSSSTAVASVGVSVTSPSPAASTVHRPSSPSSTSRYQPVPAP